MRKKLSWKASFCSLVLANFILLFFPVFSFNSDEIRPPHHFERIGPFGGDVRSLLIDAQRPNIVYLGTSNGKIFKSTDGGSSWVPLYPGIGRQGYVVDTLVQHPGEHEHIYAGSWDLHSDGGGLFESRNAGLNWTQIKLPQGSSAVRGLSICKSNPAYMIAGTLAGVYVSKDGGRGWRQVGGSELLKAESVAIDPEDHRFLYVGTWRLGYRSADFGATWSRIEKGMPLDSDVFSISINARDPESVYASACSGVFRSTNRAVSWTRLKILPDRFTIRAQVVCIDPADPHRIYSGTTEGLFVSQNDGQTWTRATSANVTVNAIQVDPTNNRRILLGTEYQGILRSEDAGRSWREVNSGFVHRQISWITPDPSTSGRLVAGVISGGGGLYFFEDRTFSWTPLNSQIAPGLQVFSLLFLPGERGRLAGTSQGVYWQPLGSHSWTTLSGSIAKRTVYSLAIDPIKQIIYAGTDQGIYRSMLAAMDFRLPPNYRFSPKVWSILAPKASPGLVYAGTSLGLLRSYDQATTWNVISAYGLPPNATIGAIAVSFSDNAHLFLGTSAGLFESKDGGIYWKRVDDGRLAIDVPSVLFLDDSGNSILAADNTSGGVFLSEDGGQGWEKIFSPEYDSPVQCAARDPEHPSWIYLGTRSDGIYRLRLLRK